MSCCDSCTSRWVGRDDIYGDLSPYSNFQRSPHLADAPSCGVPHLVVLSVVELED